MIRRKNAGPFFIKLLSTILLFYLLFTIINFDYKEFKAAFLSIKVGWVALSLLGVVIVLALKSYRWHLLLKQSGIFFSHWDSMKSYFASYAVGIVTPGRLGEFIKIYDVRKTTGANFITPFRCTLTDRLFDLSLLLIFSLSWTARHLIIKEMNNICAVLLSILLIFTIIYLLRMIMGKLASEKTGKLYKLLNFIYSCLLDMNGEKSYYLWLISLIAYFFFFLTTWFLFHSLAISISIIDTGYIISIVGLVLLLPISIAGFGTRELSLVYLLSLYGIAAEPAFAFSLLHFFVFFTWGGLIGLLFWIINPTPLDVIKADSKKIFNIIKSSTD